MGGRGEQVGVEAVEVAGGGVQYKDSGGVQLWVCDWVLRHQQGALHAHQRHLNTHSLPIINQYHLIIDKYHPIITSSLYYLLLLAYYIIHILSKCEMLSLPFFTAKLLRSSLLTALPTFGSSLRSNCPPLNSYTSFISFSLLVCFSELLDSLYLNSDSLSGKILSYSQLSSFSFCKNSSSRRNLSTVLNSSILVM